MTTDNLTLEAKTSSDSAITIRSTCCESFVNETAKESQTRVACNSGKKIFRAPPGVTPYHVKWSTVRRKSGDQQLIFVWPAKSHVRPSCLCSLVPLVRRILVGLVYLGAVHLWPGEFLPTSLPSTKPLAKPPTKCTVIEPLWDGDDNFSTGPS